jgi:2-polyprenyl-6-methoxyphenol hydroxylase-like FAD-dependent oxidoreductase
VLFADGKTIVAKLVIAADSRFSNIRRKVGIASMMKDFSKVMIVTTNIVHTSTPAEDSNIKDVPNDNHTENNKPEPTVIVPLKDTAEPKIKNLDEYTTKLSTQNGRSSKNEFRLNM